MVAVTMDFPVEDPSMLGGLAPGDRVSFSVQRLDDWRHRIIAIAPQPE
jgi:Cu/Ag efflux protein CusF